MLKIDILCDVTDSFMHEYLPILLDLLKDRGSVAFYQNHRELKGGDILLLVSCGHIYPVSLFDLYRFPVVAHPSRLPKGRGSAAVAWEILAGATELCVTLFKPTAELDRGPIYEQGCTALSGLEVMADLRKVQAELTFKLIDKLVSRIPSVNLVEQSGESSFYKRRTANDSRLEISKSIEEQFNLLRICDNDRYPAFFDYKGVRYYLKIYRENIR